MGEKRQGLTRRQVIVGAGALSMGAITLRSSKSENELRDNA